MGKVGGYFTALEFQKKVEGILSTILKNCPSQFLVFPVVSARNGGINLTAMQ